MANAALPDPFGDIIAPPLRTRPPAAAFGMAEQASPSPEPPAQPNNVILLSNPVGVRAQAAAPGAERDTPDATGPGPVAAGDRSRDPRSPFVAPAAAPPSGHSQLRTGIIVGLILAVGIVALAILFRPTPAETAARPAGATEGMAAAAERPAAPMNAAAVRLRIGPGLDAARQDALRALLIEAGYSRVDLRPMPFAIARPRVEFFDAADRAAAEAVRDLLAPVAAAPLDLRDLGPIGGAGSAGRLDVWFGG